MFYVDMAIGYLGSLVPFNLPIKPGLWIGNCIAILFLIPFLRRKESLMLETLTAVEREREREVQFEFEQEHSVRRLFFRPQGTLCYYTISIFWLGKNDWY